MKEKFVVFVLLLVILTSNAFATNEPQPPKPSPQPQPTPQPQPVKGANELGQVNVQSSTNNVLNLTRNVNLLNNPNGIGYSYISYGYSEVVADTLPELLVFWGDSLYRYTDLMLLLAVDSSVTANKVTEVLQTNSKISINRTPRKISEPAK